jgi:hypothetical protein
MAFTVAPFSSVMIKKKWQCHYKKCQFVSGDANYLKNLILSLFRNICVHWELQNSASHNIVFHSEHKFSSTKILRCAEVSGLLRRGNVLLSESVCIRFGMNHSYHSTCSLTQNIHHTHTHTHTAIPFSDQVYSVTLN